MSDEIKSPYWHGLTPTVEFESEPWPWDRAGIPAESDMFYEDGVLRSTTTARTYGGISRAAQPLLTSGKPKVLEPTSIDKATREWKFGIDYANGNDTGHVEPLRATPLMRALGYTRHPYDCSHYRKRLMLGSTTWHCQDCGSEV